MAELRVERYLTKETVVPTPCLEARGFYRKGAGTGGGIGRISYDWFI
jgi:hypothetical protein